MKKIITVANNKGGVGKSTTVMAIGSMLSSKGYKVLFIDLDAQSNLSMVLNAKNEPNTILDVFKGRNIKEVIKHAENGDIVPSDITLVSAEQLLNDTIGKEYKLKESLEQIINDYDYILIDTPPSLNILTINALVCATDVIIPVQADAFSVQGIATFKTPFDSVKKYCNKDLKINGIVITRYNGRTLLTRNLTEQLNKVATLLDTRVYETKIRECIAIKETQVLQKNIIEYAPKSNAVIDYQNLTEEVLKG